MTEGADKGIKLKEEKKPPFIQGTSYLLAIGIDEYQSFPRLYNPVRDAQKVVETLTGKYQFSKENLVELYNEQASQKNILASLDVLIDKVTDKDSLLIYFSGHGEFKSRLDLGYWLPVDGEADNHGSFISFQLLQTYLKAIKSLHTLVIADSCYSGSMFTVRSTDDVASRLESIPSRWLLTAGRNEVVKDGKPGDHSPFADAILHCLAHNMQERMRVSTLVNAVIKDVVSNARQTPRGEAMFGVGHRGGEFMFRLKDAQFTVYEDNLIVANDGADKKATPTPTEPSPPPPKPKPEPIDIQSIPNIRALQKTLLQLLAADDFEQVFSILNEVISFDSKFSNTLILQQGRYNSVLREIEEGTVQRSDAKRTFNQVRVALDKNIRKLQDRDLEPGVLG
ncbi:MAG: caspase family protein [Bacteroidota bacterium]